MKVFLQITSLCCLTATVSARIAAASHGSSSRRLERMNAPCLFLQKEIQYKDQKGNGKPDSAFECLSEGRFLTLGGDGLERLMKRKKDLKSGSSTIFVQDAMTDGTTLFLPNGKEVEIGKKNGRQLATSTGTKKTLVVRVVASDSSTTMNEDFISNKVFGTGDDKVNLKSQFSACSYNAITIDPFNGASDLGRQITDGVTTVTINSAVQDATDGDVRAAVLTQLRSDHGTEYTQFDLVMLCLPPGTQGGWIAYAYVNSYLSVYNDVWCSFPSAQMHEVGHNLNLAHSGETANYDDQSGMMGFSYSQDETPKMCFNGPKNWQLGWYSDKAVELNILSAFQSWTGDLIGIVDYGQVGDRNVILKLEAGAVDYYVSFNRKTGMNEGSIEGGNQVLVHQKEAADEVYATSKLMSKMNGGNSFAFSAGDLNFVISVGLIDFNSAIAFARVTVSVENVECTSECDICAGETCVNGVCTAGTPLVCDDNNECTTDSCSAGVCIHTDIPGCVPPCTSDSECSDDNDCTADTCSNGQCLNVFDSSVCCAVDSDCPISTVGSCVSFTCNLSSSKCEEQVATENCCGNNKCEVGENCESCPSDCGKGSIGGGPVCGDGVCDIGKGETCLNCFTDCKGENKGKQSSRFCCGTGVSNAVGCEDSRCSQGSLVCSALPSTEYCCGDGKCEGPETAASCPMDNCGISPQPCGDGICSGEETVFTCPEDCATSPSPTPPTPTPPTPTPPTPPTCVGFKGNCASSPCCSGLTCKRRGGGSVCRY